MPGRLEAAIPGNSDATEYAELLGRIHRATFEGRRPPARPRDVIAESWSRLRRRGLRPDRRRRATPDERQSGGGGDVLRSLLPGVRAHLDYLFEDDAVLLVLADAQARVVWSEGGARMRDRAESIGFVRGALWSEWEVGTNAIGTTLATRHPLHVHGAEHFCVDQHDWSCAGAPLRDPRSGNMLGVVDLSMAATDAGSTVLALASLVAHSAATELRERHRRDLHALRSASWLVTRRIAGPWIVADEWGWVAAANEVENRRRVTLPGEAGAWVPGLGETVAERMHGGWLLRPRSGLLSLPEACLEIRQSAHGAVLRFASAAGGTEMEATRRQADILLLLASHPHGLTAPQLSALLYGTPERDVTVRAEISRLRRTLGDAIVPAPYRFAEGLRVRVANATR
ncbi:GAF domain-containing protein [Microbacterium betulae]|uniref:GAF domain-containing protein n=1 Tax=Microbacterium betulae TaxID=2981139 RepID=A0AA97FI10_9MICO|nr:GAF domain-containing protein [Microbacterium sp. AB]WOF23410.1 GAF domain-containing protein [Microbacterium sp. AB]